MRKCDMYLADRSNGMTYREIADKYGISYQAVHASCLHAGGPSSLMLSSKACVYPRLRRWLNEDKERQDRFFQLKVNSLRSILRGYMQPKKDAIDLMLAFTGMTYEEMFAEEEDYG